MERFVCIHGHFYQPPRENPWLEFVELQDSAAPFHDWNERITSECYGRNTAARIFDGDGRIDAIVNNYSKISFNFGPTLLTWMKEKVPWVHDAIVEADHLSRKKFSGHGSALAQAYNHMILPLANDRDKQTQIIWGIRDFQSRFGRLPEGMWLAETAADTATLEVLAEHGIKFTVLSPFQARELRELGSDAWEDANGGRIDPSRAYVIHLPSGRSLNIFFYDAPVSQAVAFEKLLDSGEKLAGRLTGAFSDNRAWEQLVHIATDGESYGHHHRWGEMALAYALDYIESQKLARLTNYGEYLEKHPPTHEVHIHEGSAWSCSHGVGRWKENCGCNSGGHGDWHQDWRAPLRTALDWLRDQLVPAFEARANQFLKDSWQARNDYIEVILNRSDETLSQFFQLHSPRELTNEDKVEVLKLMELQRHAMLMYTSCGWFFDELSGIETVQVIQYAARAIQLAADVLGLELESQFLELLQQARSNVAEHGDGRAVYEKFVKPAMITWEKVAAHYAISSVFTSYEERTRIFLYSFEQLERKQFSSGKARLAWGTTRTTFDITRESKVYSYAVLYLGEHHLTAAVRPFEDNGSLAEMTLQLQQSFDRGEFAETIRAMDRHFGAQNFSLRSLFKDEQRRILNEILATTRRDLERRSRLVAERYTPLIRFLEDIGNPLPEALRSNMDFILHVDLLQQFESDKTDTDRVLALFDEARRRRVSLPLDELQLSISRKMDNLLTRIERQPGKPVPAEEAAGVAALVRKLPVDPNLWQARNRYWNMLKSILPKYRDKAAKGDEEAKRWVDAFLQLGHELSFAPRHLKLEG